MSVALRAWVCAVCGRRATTTGSRDAAPPRDFVPAGWVDAGNAETCPEHALDAQEYLMRLDAWYDRRRTWERSNPRPRPSWEMVGLDDEPDTEPG